MVYYPNGVYKNEFLIMYAPGPRFHSVDIIITELGLKWK